MLTQHTAIPVSSVAVVNAVSGETICDLDVTPDMTVDMLRGIVLQSVQASGGFEDFRRITLLHKGECLTDGGLTLYQVGLEGAACVLQALHCQSALLAAACDDNHIALVDADVRAHIQSFVAHSQPVSCVAFAANGKFLASGSHDRTARIWGVSQSMPCIQVLTGHEDTVSAVAFTLSDLLLTGSWDNDAKLWCWMTGECLGTFSAHTMSVNAIVPSTDGSLFLTGSNDESARVWCRESGRCTLCLTGHGHFVSSVKFSRDASTILTASLDCTAKAWDATDGHCSVTFRGHASFVHFADFSMDETLVVTASEDETAKLWSALGDCLFTLSGHSREACLIFAGLEPQNDTVVLASFRGNIHFWKGGKEPKFVSSLHLRHSYVNEVALFWPGAAAS